MILPVSLLFSSAIFAATTNAWCFHDAPSRPIRMLHHPSKMNADDDSSHMQQQQRRHFLTIFTTIVTMPLLANAVDDRTFVRTTKDFTYRFVPPEGLVPSQKPLKTHLDEVNFSNKDYKFGITVDPVRITSLAEFGTAEQVAAKVVLAEVNRDGVFDVTLMEDPKNDANKYYQLNYRSSGKRGVKRFVAKFFIRNNFLFALTAQCQEESYEALKDELLVAVDSFQIVS